MKQCDHKLHHIADDVYRGHEITLMQCPECHKFVVDVRVDNFDGAMLSGFIDDSFIFCISEAIKSVDKYELNKIELPF